MANLKISQLTESTTPGDNDLIPMVVGGATVKVKKSDLLTAVTSDLAGKLDKDVDGGLTFFIPEEGGSSKSFGFQGKTDRHGFHAESNAADDSTTLVLTISDNDEDAYEIRHKDHLGVITLLARFKKSSIQFFKTLTDANGTAIGGGAPYTDTQAITALGPSLALKVNKNTPVSSGDANTLIIPGPYDLSATVTNIPAAEAGNMYVMSSIGGTYTIVTQDWTSQVNGNKYVRVFRVNTSDGLGYTLINAWKTVGGAPSDATVLSKGIVKMSVAPAVSSDPIAIGTNDPRVSFNNLIASDVAAGEQTKLKAPENWIVPLDDTAPYYTGPALSGNKQGQECFDGKYLYRFIANDIPVRLKGV